MREYLVADLFCGAGGTSTGAERAVRRLGGRMLLAAVNHWPLAIETHKANHPTARHYVEDVTVADPERIVPEGRLDLLMASPECRYYSRARGGKPVHDQGRMNPWAVHRWLSSLDVRCLLVENVPEFVSWGPLGDDGRPNLRGTGLYFQAWIKALWEMGYAAEWRMLNAADFGDATTRVRFFLQARKDGRPIVWPEPTHSATGEADMTGQRPRWRSARDVIDWSNAGRSLLDDPRYQRRPLSEKTRRRIARGLERFGGPLAPLYVRLLGLEPDGDAAGGDGAAFLMGKQSSPALRGMDEPLPTVTTDGGIALVEPRAAPFVLGQHPAAGAISLVAPTLIHYYGNGSGLYGHPVTEPVPTVTTRARFGLVRPEARPFLVPNWGERDGQQPRVHDVEAPMPAVTSHGAGALVSPVLVDVNHAGERAARSVDAPLGTLTTKRGTGVVNPVVVQIDQQRNGNGVRSVDEPVPTLVTKASVALAEPVLEPVTDGRGDPRRLVVVDGVLHQLDIRFRMLTNRELARAMGFEDAETGYEFVGNTSEVTKQIGNAVPVGTACALVGAVLGAR